MIAETIPRRWRVGLAAILLWALLTQGVAAQGTGPVLSILEVDDAAYPRVRVLVAAADANGIPLQGLPQNAFLIAEDNRPGDILSAREIQGGVPLYVALALDISGSMAGPPLASTTQAARSFVAALAPEDQVALVKFRTDVSVASTLTTDRGAIESALQGLRAEGNTMLYDAAHRSVTLLEATPPGRRAVVLFTDGEDTGSSLTVEDAIATAQRFSVPIYVVGYGPQIKPAILTRITQRTGGAFFQAPRLEDIPVAFNQVLDALKRAYEITYLANTQADNKAHELRVTLTGPGGSTQTIGRVTAKAGNLSLKLTAEGVPSRAASEAIWAAMGKGAVPPDVPLLSRQATLIPQVTGPGRLMRATFVLDGNKLAELTTQPFTSTVDLLKVAPGPHTLAATVEDHVGNQATAQLNVAVVPPAYVTFQEPKEGTVITDAVTISLAVASIEPEKELVLKADGRELRRFAGAPYSLSWTLWREPEGTKKLEAEFTTQAGYTATAQRTITIGQHVTVRIVQPTANAHLAGNVEVRSQVNSDAPVQEVVFYVNDRQIGKATSRPYRVSFHTGDFPPGAYTIRAEARNNAGMTGSHSVAVTMTPTTRSAALIAALVGGLLVLLVIPVVVVARRRRTQIAGGAVVRAGVAGVPAAGGASAPVAWLMLTDGEAPLERYPLYPGENQIGRHRDFADIWLTDTSVSRRHAVITVSDGAMLLQNLNPDNPILVNGVAVAETATLQIGDTLQIGNTSFVIRTLEGE